MINDSLFNSTASLDEQLLNAYRVAYVAVEKIGVLETENARLTEENKRLQALLKLAQQKQ